MADNNFDDYFDYLEVLKEEQNGDRLLKRYIRDAENPFEVYADREFRNRFDKQTVWIVILPLIEQGPQTVNNRGLPIPPLIKLLICVRLCVGI